MVILDPPNGCCPISFHHLGRDLGIYSTGSSPHVDGQGGVHYVQLHPPMSADGQNVFRDSIQVFRVKMAIPPESFWESSKHNVLGSPQAAFTFCFLLFYRTDSFAIRPIAFCFSAILKWCFANYHFLCLPPLGVDGFWLREIPERAGKVYFRC